MGSTRFLPETDFARAYERVHVRACLSVFRPFVSAFEKKLSSCTELTQETRSILCFVLFSCLPSFGLNEPVCVCVKRQRERERGKRVEKERSRGNM